MLARRSPTTLALLALVAGLAVGAALSASGAMTAATTGGAAARALVAVCEPLGTLFINAIRMTVIPLVVSSLVAGIAASSDARAVGRLGLRALAVFLALLAASGLVGALVGPAAFARVSLSPAASAALRTATSSGAPAVAGKAPTVAQWITDLVPANPMKAATDGAMLPLIVFALAFGLALLALDADARAPVTRFFRGVADAMLVLVRWVLVLTPLGVFALSLPLVARLGVQAVGALASYVVVVSLAAIVFTALVVYPAASVFGRVSLGAFARAALPGQTVAFSSRSSFAALPALIAGARARLGLGEEITGFLLPLASATFRCGATLGLTIGTVFVARLYGISLGPVQIATVVVTAVLTSFSIPGVPAGSIIAMVPVLASVGLPIEGIGVLLGVDAIPDIFRTTCNVTGQIAAAAIVGARPGGRGPVARQ